MAALGTAFSLAFAGVFAAARSLRTPTAEKPLVTASAAKPSGTGTGAGLVAFIDPATGQMRMPEPGEIAALQATAPAAAAATAPLAAAELVSPAGGGVGMRLDASFDSAMVATKGPDGKLKVDCVVGEAAANAIVNRNSNLSRTKTLNEY
jgi:hypothetical protein